MNYEKNTVEQGNILQRLFNITAVLVMVQKAKMEYVALCVREKGRDLLVTQSYDKSPCIHRKIQKEQNDNTNTPPKT